MKSELPNVYYGDVPADEIDWRDEDLADEEDDDEDSDSADQDLIDMLGFDPFEKG